MKQTRLAPLVGIAGCVLVVVLLVVPYVVVASAGTAVGLYYSQGVVNPLVAGVFAAVGVIVLGAGSQGRAEADVAAGVAVAVGAATLALVALWAVTLPSGVVFDMDAPSVIEYHRWVTTGSAALVPVSGVWWARALGLV